MHEHIDGITVMAGDRLVDYVEGCSAKFNYREMQLSGRRCEKVSASSSSTNTVCGEGAIVPS